MSWRYSDHAEKPAEAAEPLPAFDGDAAELDVALVNAVEAIRRRAAAQLATTSSRTPCATSCAPSTTSPCTTARGDGGCSAPRARRLVRNLSLRSGGMQALTRGTKSTGACAPVPVHWRGGLRLS